MKITCLYPQLSDSTRQYGTTFHDKPGLSFHVACVPSPEWYLVRVLGDLCWATRDALAPRVAEVSVT